MALPSIQSDITVISFFSLILYNEYSTSDLCGTAGLRIRGKHPYYRYITFCGRHTQFVYNTGKMQYPTIYSIGHSNHDMTVFLKLLKEHAIQVVVDVRSAPYSRYVPQFNKKVIEAAVADAGMRYIFMGCTIGGRPSDSLYSEKHGVVMYDKLVASDRFQQGLDRLAKGFIDGWVIAILCAEEDPLKCHRHFLIARELELKRNIPVWHVRSDGTKIRAKKLFENSSG